MGSTIFIHHTFMATDFGFSSEMQKVNRKNKSKNNNNSKPSLGLVALLNVDE